MSPFPTPAAHHSVPTPSTSSSPPVSSRRRAAGTHSAGGRHEVANRTPPPRIHGRSGGRPVLQPPGHLPRLLPLCCGGTQPAGVEVDPPQAGAVWGSVRGGGVPAGLNPADPPAFHPTLPDNTSGSQKEGWRQGGTALSSQQGLGQPSLSSAPEQPVPSTGPAEEAALQHTGRGHSRAAWGLTQPRTAATQTRSRTRSCTAATHRALRAGMGAHACELCAHAAAGGNTQHSRGGARSVAHGPDCRETWHCVQGIQAQMCTLPCTLTCIYTHAHSHTCIPMHTCIHTHAHSHTCTPMRTHIQIHTCTLTHMHSHAHTHAYTPMHTHTHAHTGEAQTCAAVQHSYGLRTSNCSRCTQSPPAAPYPHLPHMGGGHAATTAPSTEQWGCAQGVRPSIAGLRHPL